MKHCGPQKAPETPLLGSKEKREWWDADSNSGISYVIVAHSFQVITGLSNAGILIAS